MLTTLGYICFGLALIMFMIFILLFQRYSVKQLLTEGNIKNVSFSGDKVYKSKISKQSNKEKDEEPRKDNINSVKAITEDEDDDEYDFIGAVAPSSSNNTIRTEVVIDGKTDILDDDQVVVIEAEDKGSDNTLLERTEVLEKTELLDDITEVLGDATDVLSDSLISDAERVEGHEYK